MLKKKKIKATLTISQFETSHFKWWWQRFQKRMAFLRGLLGHSQV